MSEHEHQNATASAPAAPVTLEDLMTLSGPELHAIMDRGYPIDPEAMAGKQYLGADLSMPKFGHALLWQTFRKTFVRDEQRGDVRGWNVRMEQHGLHGPRIPKVDKHGVERAFAHYRVRDATGITWPRGWSGQHYFDYGVAGNTFTDRFGFTPVVAVNEGSSDLVLGWEIFRVAGRMIAPSMYWAIQADGPVETIVEPPKRPRG